MHYKSNVQTINDLNPECMRWQCRRGMSELEEVLTEFYTTYYSGLSIVAKQQFYALLQQPDQMIMDWLSGSAVPEDLGLQTIIIFIQQQLAVEV